MFYPQNHVLARDVDEHDITRLQAQEFEVMTPGTPFAVLGELRDLYARIQAAADKLARDNERLLELQSERKIQQRAIVFGLAETDDVARAYGFPAQGPYMAGIGLALLRLPDDVAIVMESQSYPGFGGGG